MLGSGGLRAQRHGRADSAQQYAKSIPEATFTITFDGRRHVLAQRDLTHLSRTSREVAGKEPGSVRKYSGVLLTDLVSADPSLRRYDIHHGFFHITHLDESMLMSPADILVADHI